MKTTGENDLCHIANNLRKSKNIFQSAKWKYPLRDWNLIKLLCRQCTQITLHWTTFTSSGNTHVHESFWPFRHTKNRTWDSLSSNQLLISICQDFDLDHSSFVFFICSFYHDLLRVSDTCWLILSIINDCYMNKIGVFVMKSMASLQYRICAKLND